MEFGPEIKVDGVRPEWLKDDDTMEYRHVMDAPSGQMIQTQNHAKWSKLDWGCVVSIRLIANHLAYSTPDERAVAPELVSRLVEFAKKVSKVNFNISYIGDDQNLAEEARAIVAALEPDIELAEARKIAKGWLIYDDADSLQATEPAMKAILKAIRRGRQLEKEGK